MRKPFMRVAPPIVLDDQQRKTLEQWARSRSLPMRQVQRARIILMAADGKQDLEIAAAINISNQRWLGGVSASCKVALLVWRRMLPGRESPARLRRQRFGR
jgi:hypothetical protein